MKPTLAALLAVLGILSSQAAAATKPWNILFCFADDWGRYDYAFGKRPGEQLFDLRNDPDQTVNIAADPKYAKTRADMEQRLMGELERTGDPRLVEGGKFFETPPMSGPLTGTGAPATKKRGQRK